MDVFAGDLEAAGLLALARHDDGPPPAVTPPPAGDGQGRHTMRLAGTGQVIASQAEMIAAAPGRAPGRARDSSNGRPGGGMSRGAIFRPGVTDDTRLAQARERFLAAEPVEPGQVRDMILASWWRSRRWHVAADRIDLCYVRDPDLDTPLTRNALPVLHNLYRSNTRLSG